MKQSAFYFLFFFSAACSKSQQPLVKEKSNEAVLHTSIFSRPIPNVTDIDFDTSYNLLKDSVDKHRKLLYKSYLTSGITQQKIILDSAQRYLQEVLVHNIFPYWYGTVWDFNGISNRPQHGFIACGYFVSTTLKHTGFNINRYKLAQQYSHSIVNTLCTDVCTFNSMQKMLLYISQQPDQLYIIGLDNHVGFINKEGSDVHFIHSSFVTPGYVISETAKGSVVLPSSLNYVLGSMLTNKTILLKWMKGETVPIIP